MLFRSEKFDNSSLEFDLNGAYRYFEIFSNNKKYPVKIICKENIEALEDTYTVYHDVLNTHCTDELFLDSWPTDLDIYKNNFLISSNEGIQTFKCNREQNGRNVKIDFDKNIKNLDLFHISSNIPQISCASDPTRTIRV